MAYECVTTDFFNQSCLWHY